MEKNNQTRERLIEDFKALLERECVDADEKLAQVLEYLDAIIHSPSCVVH